jgi:hypothetical protein
VAAALFAAACSPAAAPALTADQVPAAFVAASQAADRTMHMDWNGTYGMGGVGAETMPFSATIDFAGADYAGTFTASTNAPDLKPEVGTGQTEIALVGGQGYQRSEYSNGWQRMTPAPPSLDPFQGLTAADVAYVAQETRDGARVHHLRLTNMSGLASTIFSGLAGGSVGPVRFNADNSTFDVYVDAAGHPVAATLNLGTDAIASDFGAISVTSTYAFTNWGGQFYIVAPAVP